MAGIKNLNGLPLIYRDSQYASRGFKIDSDLFKGQSLIPRPKFLFFVKFNRATGETVPNVSTDTARDLNRLSNTKTGIVFQVKSIDKPKFNIRTETLIQYNKKRVIQTRIDYNPMTIQFHDDITDKVLRFWKDYYSFYYGDVRQGTSDSWRDDIVATGFDEGIGQGWGYKGADKAPNANGMHFLQNIQLVQFYGGRKTTMTFVHPKISSFDHDASDYADGTTGTGIVIQFDYEGVLYDIDQDLRVDFEQFGFNEADYRLLDEQFVRTAPVGGGEVDGIFSGIQSSSQNVLPTRNQGNFGSAAITNRIISEAITRVSAGPNTLAGSGISFGTGALGTFAGNVGSLVTATSLAGQVPSPDLIQKETGVKSTINNFGVFQQPTIDDRLTNPRTITNTGLDSSKVTQAAAIINSNVVIADQEIAPGQTVLADPKAINSFSRSFGTGAALAKNQGIISDIADFPDAISSDSGSSDTMVNKLPNGNYQLTNKGSAVMNSLRSPNSVVGSRRPVNPWTNPDAVNTNRRNLDAETNNQNPLND